MNPDILGMHAKHMPWAAAGIALVNFLMPGCREQPRGADAQESRAGAPVPPGKCAAPAESTDIHRQIIVAREKNPEADGPAEVVRRLHDLHARGSYSQIGPLVVEERREQLVEFLLAIQEVLAANDRMAAAFRRSPDLWLPRGCDLGIIADNLGPFSRTMKVIRAEQAGGEATVAIQEGNHVPLARLRLERREGAWQYRPEAVRAETIEALRKLAEMVREMGESVDRGMTAAAMADAFEYRVFPQVRRVQQAARRTSVAAGGQGDD